MYTMVAIELLKGACSFLNNCIVWDAVSILLIYADFIGMSVLSSQTAEATEVKLGRNVGLDLRISVFFCDLDPRPFDLRGRNFCCFLPAETAIEPGNVYYFA